MSSRIRPLLIKFENLPTKNFIQDNCNKLKESEQFRKVILIQDLTKEEREEYKLFIEKDKRSQSKRRKQQMGGQVRGQIVFYQEN